MSPKNKKRKPLEPLEPDDIRMRLRFVHKVSIAELARRWTERLGRPVYAPDISAMIARRPDCVFQEYRELLAEVLGVDVSQVGRESRRETTEQAAA